MQFATRPNFVCIGAQKAGTTWLYDNLFTHPDVWMPFTKELHFFNVVCPNEALMGYEVPVPTQLKKQFSPMLSKPSLVKLRWLYNYYYAPKTVHWYADLFKPARDNQITGDITPAYSTLDERGVRFAEQVLPKDCKILLVLRDPAERAWSAIKMLARWHKTDVSQIDLNVLKSELDSPSHNLRGDYPRILNLWEKYFSGRLQIFLYEDLVKKPDEFYQSVCEFLMLKPEIDQNTLLKRSNTDQKKMAMPKDVRLFLSDYFYEDVMRVEERIEGVADIWLGG